MGNNVLVSIETDEDALVLQGANDEIIDLSKEQDPNVEYFTARIQHTFPDMRLHMVADLLPLFLGNIEHVTEVRKSKRILKEEGVVLMASAGYRDQTGIEKMLAEEKAKSLSHFAYQGVKDNVPELMKHMSVLVGTVDMNTRLFTRIPFKP